MTRIGGWVSLAAAVLGAGCTAGVGSEISEPVRPVEAWSLERLAVVPVTVALGSEDAAPVVEATVLAHLSRHFPTVEVTSAETARSRLGEARAGATLAQLVRDYEDAGVVGVASVDSVAHALDVPVFLQLRVGHADSRVLRRDILADEVYDEDRREIVVVARLWAAGAPSPAWEASSRAHSETGLLSTELPVREEMLRVVVERLLERIPLAESPAAGPEKKILAPAGGR